jgi:hypothetical protein
MKKLFQAAVVAAAVLAVPAMSLAAQTTPAATASSKPAAKAAAAKSAPAALRSARGVVKSMDASSLVLTEQAGRKKKSHDVRFVLDNSTQKDGNVAVGSAVQVKYHNDAKKHVATEVLAAGKKS